MWRSLMARGCELLVCGSRELTLRTTGCTGTIVNLNKSGDEGAGTSGEVGDGGSPSLMTRLLELAKAVVNGYITAEEAAREVESNYPLSRFRLPGRCGHIQCRRGRHACHGRCHAGRRAPDEKIARTISPMRNDEKVAARALMSPGEVAVVEQKNMRGYDNAIGPTPEQLYERYGTWQGVIDAAYRTNPRLNAIMAALGS
jgi:hypothetical protein